MHGHPDAMVKWKEHLQYFQDSKEIIGIEVRNTFPGVTTLQILQKIQDKLEVCQTSPEASEDRIIFMSMFNVDWTKKIPRNVFRIPKRSRTTQKVFCVDMDTQWKFSAKFIQK